MNEVITISDKLTIRQAIRRLESASYKILFVQDSKNKKLVGSLTDGDIRRYLIKTSNLNSLVTNAMNKDFIWVKQKSSASEIETLLEEHGIMVIPELNGKFELIKFHIAAEEFSDDLIENAIVIFAGGLGKRLRSITKDKPKPLASLGKNKILIDQVLNICKINNAFNVYVTVNYKKNQIIKHLSKSQQKKFNLNFIRESGKPLGTAGSLALLKPFPELPIIVLNADILHKLSFHKLLEFHNSTKSDFTLVGRNISQQLPFGVIRNDEFSVSSVEEKPELNFIINAGIYVINPSVLKLIRKNTRIDMPELINLAIKNKFKVKLYPIHEYWIDVGTPKNFVKAKNEWENFS